MDIKQGRRFGRKVSVFDSRDWSLKDFMKGFAVPANPNKEWAFPQESLDQGETSHCVGFGMADFGINLPVFTPYTNEAGDKFYRLCKIQDNDPDGEDGTTIRSAANVLKNEGIINAYAFAFDMSMVKWWLRNRGPLLVGTIWTTNMMEPDSENLIYPTGDMLGGHGYLVNGIRDNKLRIQNSWGSSWGINGAAYMLVSDFEQIFRYNGEAMTAVELENH